MKKNIRRVIYFISSLMFIYFIYKVSTIFYIIGLKELSKKVLLGSFAIYLIIPLIKCVQKKQGINISKLDQENKINNQLKKIKANIDIIKRPTLKKEEDTVECDYIIITNKGVFNIKCCDYKGKITIEEDNRWILKKRNKLINLKSPLKDVMLQRDMLLNQFNEEELIDLIVMTEDRVDVENENNSLIPVIRYSDLKDYINEYDNKDMFNTQSLYNKIYKIIYKCDVDQKMNNNYFKYYDYRYQLRSRILIILMVCILFFRKFY